MTLVLSESFEDSKRKTFDFCLELSPSIATPQATKRQRRNSGRVNDWIMWSCHDWTCCIQELTLFPFDIRVVWALCGYPWLRYYGLSCTSLNPLRDLLGGFSIDRRGAGSKEKPWWIHRLVEKKRQLDENYYSKGKHTRNIIYTTPNWTIKSLTIYTYVIIWICLELSFGSCCGCFDWFPLKGTQTDCPWTHSWHPQLWH